MIDLSNVCEGLALAISQFSYAHNHTLTRSYTHTKPCVVRALCEYTAMKSDELSFCKDAIITNVERVNSSRWKGDYGRRKGRWFPAKYVKEIDISHLVDEEREQGSLKHQVIDITGCLVEMQNVPRSSMYMLRILSKTSGDSIVTPVLEVAADSSKEIIEWHHTIENQQMKAVMQSKKVSTVEQAMEQQEQRKRIAKELSDLVICFYSVPFAFEREYQKCSVCACIFITTLHRCSLPQMLEVANITKCLPSWRQDLRG